MWSLQRQSDLRLRSYVQLFYALNAMVIFGSPYLHRWRHYVAGHMPFPEFGTSQEEPLTPVRSLFLRLSKPIRWEDFTCAIHVAISALVGSLSPKNVPNARRLATYHKDPRTTVRSSLKQLHTPIACAESNSAIHVSVCRLMASLSQRASQVSRIRDNL